MLQCIEVLAVDVQQNDVLRIGCAKPPAPVFLRKLGQNPQLLAGRPTAYQRHADIVKRVAPLPVNPKMRPVAGGNLSGFRLVRATQFPSKPGFNLLAKARYFPLLDQELQSRTLAILAVPVIAKHRGNGESRRERLVGLHQHAQVF